MEKGKRQWVWKEDHMVTIVSWTSVKFLKHCFELSLLPLNISQMKNECDENPNLRLSKNLSHSFSTCWRIRPWIQAAPPPQTRTRRREAVLSKLKMFKTTPREFVLSQFLFQLGEFSFFSYFYFKFVVYFRVILSYIC